MLDSVYGIIYHFPIYGEKPLGKGSSIDNIFEDLSKKSRWRQGTAGKVYSFFQKRLTLPSKKIELRSNIDLVVKHLVYERDSEAFDFGVTVLSRFRPDEFDRENTPNPLKARLLPKDRSSETSKTARLSTRLGILPIYTGKGKHGSKIYFNLGCRPIAIFKSGEVNNAENVERKIVSFFSRNGIVRTQDTFLPIPWGRPKAAMISERATYLLSEILGIDLVPTTEVLEMDKERGSFQHFVQGYREADEVKLPSLDHANEKDLTKFQMFGLFDYLTGGLDRKGDNWLVLLDDEGHIADIEMIDNGNNFPTNHVPRSAYFASRNQYKWKKYPLAQAPLTDGSKAFITDLSTEKIDRLLQISREEFGEDADEFFSPAVMKTLCDRLEIMKSFQTGDKSLAELANYNTPNDFMQRYPSSSS